MNRTRNVKTDKYVKEISVLRAAQRDGDARPHAKLRVLRRNGTKIANPLYANWIISDEGQNKDASRVLDKIMEKAPAEQYVMRFDQDDNGLWHMFLDSRTTYEWQPNRYILVEPDLKNDNDVDCICFWEKNGGLWTFKGVFQSVKSVMEPLYALRFNKYDMGKSWVGGNIFDVVDYLEPKEKKHENKAEARPFDGLDELLG